MAATKKENALSRIKKKDIKRFGAYNNSKSKTHNKGGQKVFLGEIKVHFDPYSRKEPEYFSSAWINIKPDPYDATFTKEDAGIDIFAGFENVKYPTLFNEVLVFEEDEISEIFKKYIEDRSKYKNSWRTLSKIKTIEFI